MTDNPRNPHSGNGTRRPAGSRPAGHNTGNGRSASGGTHSTRSAHSANRAANPNRRTASGTHTNPNTSPRRKGTKRDDAKKKRRNILIIEVAVLLVLVVVLFAWSKLGQIKVDDEIEIATIDTNELPEEVEEMLKGYTTIALFGVDNRSNGNYDTGNSDSIMIVSINNDTKEVRIASVYRDTAMDVDGNGTIKKCNYAYNHGGAKDAIEMLNRNCDIAIQGYVAVDFAALTKAIDAVGGVEIPVEQDEIDGWTSPEGQYLSLNTYIDEVSDVTGIKSSHVKSAGLQTLDGVQATSYCRIRFTSGGDFRRAERQRLVVNELVKKMQSADIGELNKLIDAIFPHVATSFSLSQLMGMAVDAKEYNLSQKAGFPFALATGSFGSAGSLDVPCTLEANVKMLYLFLYDDATYEPSSTVQDISTTIETMTGYHEGAAQDYGYGTANP